MRACLCVCRVALAALFALLLCAGCAQTDERWSARPAALLHQANDLGYIPPDAQMLEVDISAPQAFVYDCTAGTMLYRKGEERVLYPASTTKLLTVLCALEILSPDEVVTPGDELSLVAPGSSVAYIKPHHALTVEMLVEGMLLPSGNDAAYALAAAAGERLSDGACTGAAAVEVFVQEMARYGADMGLVGSSFCSPDGFSGEEHYSTLEDLALIARAATENEVIMRYASLAADDVRYASGHTNRWVNTNQMLQPDSPYYHSAVTGLKTGSLEGNYCLVSTLELEGEQYIIGVFSARDTNARYTDTLAIIDALTTRVAGRQESEVAA